jgi:hypothetical protein
MRITLDDADRLTELRDFLRSVHAVAVIVDGELEVHLVGGHNEIHDARRLRAYLDTWLKLHGRGLRAAIDGEALS